MADGAHTDESGIHRVWELTGRRRPAEALAAAAALSARLSGNRDLLYLQALNLRLLDRVPEALAALEALARVHPGCSRLHEERGQCHTKLRDGQRALDAFREAVRINPALPASWLMLQRLSQAKGDSAGAAAAGRQLAALQTLPPAVVEAGSLLADGYLMPAEDLVRAHLQKDPRDVKALRLLARIGMERGALEEAEALLAAVLTQAPDFHAARLDHAMVLLRQQKHLPARQEAERLLAREPGNREYLKLQGAACIGLGDYAPVIPLYERLLKDIPPSGPEAADLKLWRGNALKSMGRQPEAIADYHAALAARPDFAVAWFSLANLKTYRFPDDEVARMQALEQQPGLAAMDRCYLCFALGKALEDRGDYASSWRCYERGNALMRAGSGYRRELTGETCRQLEQVCTPEFFGSRAGWGVSDPAPLFILGLPRSGSTLIEQILASHSQVEGTEELTGIERCFNEMGGRDGPSRPEALQRITADDARRLGERYLAETFVHRRLGRAYFIDKMPNNFWHIGLIQLLLPRAKIIDARREPMACCFGNLKQLFGTTRQEFSYSIEDIAHYYRTYLKLMQHWKSVRPGQILTVHHEDLVEDLEGQVRRILAHCGLPFEAACLEFHKTRRSVRSASSEQVRQPIDRGSVHQWRHYEPWLGPLKDALGEALTAYRD